MKKPPTNVAASVRARLLNIRVATGEDYNELLVRFCLERLLYRLSVSSHREQFILKGAPLFSLWKGFPHRRTRDLDLLGFGDPQPGAVAAVFRDIVAQSVPDDDGVVFDAATVEAEEIKAQDEYVGARVTLLAHIGPARLTLQVDVGYGDSLTPPPVEETCSLQYSQRFPARSRTRERVASSICYEPGVSEMTKLKKFCEL